MLRKIVPILLAAMFVVMGITVFNITRQDKQNLSGELWVKRSPQITSITLYDNDNGDLSSPVPTDELTPFDEMTLVINITFPDDGYLYSVDVVFYHNLVGLNAPDNTSHHATYHWDRDIGDWSVSPSGTTWDVDTQNSSVPTDKISGDDQIILVFTPSKIARYSSTGNWVIYVKITDLDNPTLLYGESELTSRKCKFYLEMSVDSTNFGFGYVPPGCENVSFNYTGGINITVITNYYWNLKLNATGWYNDTGHLIVNFSEFDSLLADDDPTCNETKASETGLEPVWVKPGWSDPNYPSGWFNLAPSTDDITGTLIRLYLFVTLPSDIPYGHYTTTLSIITEQH